MYYFIVNPKSRSGMGKCIWNNLRARLLQQNIEFRSYLTEHVGHATTLSRQISSLGTPDAPVTLVTVGGDGTIYEVLTGISDLRSVIFGYIPTGSGNDFCRGMALPKDPDAALTSIIRQDRIMEMDVPCISSEGSKYRFGISAGMGYDAAVCQEVLSTPFKKIFNRLHLGKLIYLFIALKKLMFLHLFSMTLHMEGDRIYHYDNVYFTAVMNQKYEGGGFKFCPDASPQDGMLDVITAEGMSKLKLLLMLPTAFFGKHVHVKGIHIFRCKSIDINTSAPVSVHKDGESGGISDKISIFLENNSLKVIMPMV